MPRPRVVRKGAFLTAWLEEEYLILLDKVARAEGISRSELLRRIIVEWLESSEVKAKYGLQVVFAEQVARASTAKLAPLTEKKLEDLKRALEEVAPVIDRVAKLLPQKMDWARVLIARRNEYLRLKEKGGWVRVGGDLVPAEQHYRTWLAQHEGDLKMLEGMLEEWKRARARFFKRVYYLWVGGRTGGLRKEVPAEVMLEFDDKIAVLLKKIDEVEPLANELEKLLRQPSAGQGVKR
jgi:hypothetical protein